MNRGNKYNSEIRRGSSGKNNEVELDAMIGKLQIPSGKSKEQVWQTILEKLENQPEVKTISLAKVILKVAASLLILIASSGSIWIWGFGAVTIYSPKGQHTTKYLPDGSKIELNADTKISYNKALWFIDRKVYVNGEVLFKVVKGKRFEVIADLATTSVLGTTFNVYARNGQVKVNCIEGKVLVKNNTSNKKVILTAGLCTQTVNTKLISPVETVKREEVSWTFGEFYFNNTPLSEVFKEIERQFNVEITYSDVEKRFYTGYFNTKDISDALKLVCVPMELSYSVNDKLIVTKVSHF